MSKPAFEYDFQPPADADPSAVTFVLRASVDGVAYPDVPAAPLGAGEDPATAVRTTPALLPSADPANPAKATVGYVAFDAAGNPAVGPTITFPVVDDIPPAAPEAPTPVGHREVSVDDNYGPTPAA